MIEPCTHALVVWTGCGLVVHGRRRAGEVVDLVHLEVEGEGDVVTDELEEWVVHEMRHVLLAAGVEVVEAEHLVALPEQVFAQVRAQKAGAAGDQSAHRTPPVFLGDSRHDCA